MTYPLLGKLGFGLQAFSMKAENDSQCVSVRIFRQENSESEHKDKDDLPISSARKLNFVLKFGDNFVQGAICRVSRR